MRASRKSDSRAVLLSLGLFAIGCTGSGTSGNADAMTQADGGDGDMAMVSCSPEGAFDGAPVTATAGQWTWVDEPKALCRDGSATGFGVRLNPNSDKLLIYFQGGGACFNSATCGANPANFNSGTFALAVLAGGQQGIFNASDSANPFRDWNAVFIPYCTGDVHAGAATGITANLGLVRKATRAWMRDARRSSRLTSTPSSRPTRSDSSWMSSTTRGGRPGSSTNSRAAGAGPRCGSR